MPRCRLRQGNSSRFLDHDDELAPEALAEVVRYLNAHPDADVIYSDEDKLDEAGRTLRSVLQAGLVALAFPQLHVYLPPDGRAAVSSSRRSAAFAEASKARRTTISCLRLMERTERIHHIPRILYHWRKSPASTASSGAVKPWALEAGRRALEEHARRTGMAAEVLPGPHPGMYRLRRSIQNEPLVSIVIPTTGLPHGKRGDLLARCLRSLEKTAWRRFEVVVCDRQRTIERGGEARARTIAAHGGRLSGACAVQFLAQGQRGRAQRARRARCSVQRRPRSRFAGLADRDARVVADCPKSAPSAPS